MTTRRLFTLAAVAWLVAAVARPALAGAGLLDLGGDPARTWTAASAGAAAGIVVGVLHLVRSTRGTALFGLVVGSPAIFTLVAVPQVGEPAAVAVLAATGLTAYLLSAACLWRTVREPARGDR